MKRKSQVAIEFMFAVGVVLLIFISILAINLNRKMAVRSLDNQINMRSECLKLSSSITSAYIADTGLNLTTKLKYNASVFADDRIISLEYEGINVYCSFPLNMVSDSTARNFELEKGDISIQNIDKTVVIKNV